MYLNLRRESDDGIGGGEGLYPLLYLIRSGK